MRGSARNAASSARRAMSIFSSVARPSTSLQYSPRSPAMDPSSRGIRQPGVRILRGDVRPVRSPSAPSGECHRADRSEVYAEPVCLPFRMRSPAARDPASFSVSTSRRRTLAENSSPSLMVHSASVAPAASACCTISAASSHNRRRSRSRSRRASHGHAVDLDGRECPRPRARSGPPCRTRRCLRRASDRCPPC